MRQLLDKVAPARTRRRRPQKQISKWLSVEAVDAGNDDGALPAYAVSLNVPVECQSSSQWVKSNYEQEAQLSLRDRATRACQLKSGKVLHKCRRLVFEKV